MATDLIVGLWLGFLYAVVVFLCTSILYFVSMHRVGAADYLAKTIAIGLLTIPVTILLSLVPIVYLVAVTVRSAVLRAGATWRWMSRSKPTSCLDCDDPDDSDEVIVHLVHGTFEPMAPWTLPGSPMRKAIEGINHRVKVTRFSWSGRNSATARSQAAKALANKLEGLPNSRHYIVAHSHGGNIVREMSLICPQAARSIHGVCLLSPPFIFRKNITRTAGNFMLLNAWGFVLAVQIPTAAVLLPFGIYWPVGAIGASVAAFFLEFWLSKQCRNSYANEIDVEQESVDLRNVQIYHAIGDEAESGLRFVSFLHETCFGVLAQLKAAAELAKVKVHWPYVASYVYFIGVTVYCVLALTDSKDWIFVNLAGMAFILIAHIIQVVRSSKDDPSVLLTAALPIVTFSFWLAVLKAIAYGDWRLIFCPEIFISSSETPEGDHKVLKFAPQSDGIMLHSTHSHPLAVQNVASWLNCSLKKEDA